MKKTFTLLFSLIASLSFGQISLTALDFNNVSALVTDVGTYFSNPSTGVAAYEIPKGSGMTTMYQGAMWFAGTDVNGQIKLAAPVYYDTLDIWPGALTNDGAATLPSPNPLSQTIWEVTKAEIDNHILNYQQVGYVVPSNILNWPAHGDTTVGQAYYLAPFVDVDFDGDYHPENGDFPCIKGDDAVYVIVNDKGGLHGSGGDPIGVEVHYMFYQFLTNDYLNNTTFIEARVINRGTQTLYDYATTFFADPDIGNYIDDFMGCDSTRNLMYAYNGDDMDENNGGIVGYGASPPAAGIVCLSHDISRSGVYTNGLAYPYSDPVNAIEFWNTMHGRWSDSSVWLDNNSQPTNFLYSGNPYTGSGWSEQSAGSIPGDRRMHMTVDKGILTPWEEYTMTFAVVYARDNGTNLSSVDKLFATTDSLQTFYDNMTDNCYMQSLSIEEIASNDFNVYPNPTNGIVTFQFPDENVDYNIAIRNISGQVVWSGNKQSLVNGTVQLETSPGIYFVTVGVNGLSRTKKIIVE